MRFQKIYNGSTCFILNFQPTDVNAADFFRLQHIEPFFIEEVLCAMFYNEGTFATFFYKTVAAAVGLIRSGHG